MESVDRTSIQTDRLAYMWKVEMKMKDNIKWEGVSEKGVRKKEEKNTVTIEN